MQTPSEIKEIITTTDSTVEGILIAICITFGLTIIYLYKQIQKINNNHMSELRKFNETLIKVNNSYNEFTANMVILKK